MKGKHAQKNFGRWRHDPDTTISQNPEGGGAGGAGGGVAYKDRARLPPVVAAELLLSVQT